MESAPQVSNTRATLAYVLPFAVFVALLALQKIIPIPQWVRFAAPLFAIALLSRGALRKTPVRPLSSIAIGAVVFFIWVGPEFLFPGLHRHWLFSNAILGQPATSVTTAEKSNAAFIVFRILVSVITVPILEELFWRGWLMRWMIDLKFERVPLGTYARQAFWAVAALFAMEHGSFWEVGLITGVVYNWWMLRTKSMWDCILMHAVTNACLAWYVIQYDQWMYWL